MEVPTILVPGFARASQLGNTNEVLNTMKLFALTSLDNQRLIAHALESVWSQFDWSIDPLELIEEIPDWLVAKLTADEIRELGGYDAISDDGDQQGATTADALSALSPLVATKVLERMTDAEIRSLIGLSMEGYIPKQTPQ
jgi:hypothetical protein